MAELVDKMAAASVGPSPVEERMPYYKKRVEVFEKFLEREQAKLEAAKAANVAIKVIMPDGKERAAVQGVTTPMDIAKEISASLAKKVVVADVDGHAWDLARPLEGDCALKLFSFDDTEGKDVSIAGGDDLGFCQALADAKGSGTVGRGEGTGPAATRDPGRRSAREARRV